MHRRIRAARLETARDRIAATATVLAQRYGVQDLAEVVINAGHRDPELDTLFRLEAVAGLLEAIASQPQPAPMPGPDPAPVVEAEPVPTPRRSRRKKGDG